ncbi:DUF2185 domain-containing protein [Silvimonas amylolytica]|uniref:Immunity protein Imm33 domain-containing protein n=1 Tax=Silvimonas amylolytica TaxID=449663 RepID=A0ABQ2PHK3_9NEIS|nr:DUF2185 domain-containing protein [Silvimonas amylolytica]GGP24790.1 hypothetical protein GCM10010971_06090 [Silvimonas amylolytica]
MQKQYVVDPRKLEPLASDKGLCMVTDLILVEGQPVGYMVREEPEDKEDSGWRFFSGAEDDRYLDNPKHFNLVDVNLVANCDPGIVEYLDAPVGAAFDKHEGVFYDVSEDD